MGNLININTPGFWALVIVVLLVVLFSTAGFFAITAVAQAINNQTDKLLKASSDELPPELTPPSTELDDTLKTIIGSREHLSPLFEAGKPVYILKVAIGLYQVPSSDLFMYDFKSMKVMGPDKRHAPMVAAIEYVESHTMLMAGPAGIVKVLYTGFVYRFHDRNWSHMPEEFLMGVSEYNRQVRAKRDGDDSKPTGESS